MAAQLTQLNLRFLQGLRIRSTLSALAPGAGLDRASLMRQEHVRGGAAPAASAPEALTRAPTPAERRSLVLVVYTPGCGWSRKQLAALPAAVAPLRAQGLRVATLDVARAEGLAAEFGIRGFPHTLLFDAQGRKRGELEGFLPAAELVQEAAAR